MASITAGNELYLYLLFMREIGAGRQVMLARMEEVLLQDDILPCDLGCADVREVLENLSGFVRLTVFKKGRVYATVVPNPTWNEVLARADKTPEPQPKEKGGARSWKRKRAKKDPKPAKPRPKNRPKPSEQEVPATEEAEREPAETAASEQSVEPAPSAVPSEDDLLPTTQPEHEPAPAAAAEPTAEPEPVATPEPTPAEPAPTEEPAPEEPAPAEAVQEPSTPVSSASTTEPDRPRITLTVTYDPTDDLEQDAPEEFEPAPAPLVPESPSPTSQLHYPQNFSAEVTLHNEELSALYQMLPLDVDPFVLLDEDWRVARSTHDFTQEGNLVTFPLRYVKEPGGEPVRVTMRRARERGSSKRWTVCALDHVDGVGFEGLPVTGTDVMRALAQFALLGPWDELVDQLSHALEGASAAPVRDELRSYLCLTFHRIQCEHKFCTYDEGAHGAFNTGLLDASNQSILMCFDACAGDVCWEFSGFRTAEDTVFDGAAPLPAAYLRTLSDILIDPQTPVHIDKRLVQAYGESLEKALHHALRRAQRDYRLCAPAYDPLANELRLLVPVTLQDEVYALVLHPHEEGYAARALLPRDHAAAHARVVSFELPRWLLS